MRTNAITIAAAATWLPPHLQPPSEVGGTPEDSGYTSLAVSDGPSAPEMAVLAANAALDQAGWDGAELDLLLHAWSYYQGHDFWSPAHYVADQLGAAGALPVGIQQMCNGGAAAVQSAAAHLLADPSATRALVTTADRFSPPGFDRWASDLGVAYGDGASAVLLCRADPDPASPADAGPAERSGTADRSGAVGRLDATGDGGHPAAGRLRLLAVTSVSAPQLEAMHRGDDAFAAAARSTAERVDVRRTKRAYLRRYGSAGYRRTERERITALLEASMREAGTGADDPALRYVVLPRVHRGPLESVFVPIVEQMTGAEPVDFGSATGHLGAGDLTAGIADLLDQKMLQPGEKALVLSTGAGFTWSCAAVVAGTA